jgi:hypothetical protein
MSYVKHRVANPTATTTQVVHGPKNAGTGASGYPPADVVANGTSNGGVHTWNWSGANIYYPNNSEYFAQNGSEAIIGFQVPTFGYENCSYAPLPHIRVGGLRRRLHREFRRSAGRR